MMPCSVRISGVRNRNKQHANRNKMMPAQSTFSQEGLNVVKQTDKRIDDKNKEGFLSHIPQKKDYQLDQSEVSVSRI